MGNRKIEIVAAVVELRAIGIAHRVVDELVMREVMQTELERRGVDRKCGEPIRNKLVELFIVEQDEVRAFVDDAAELMLRCSDDDDRDEGRRNVPPPAETRRGDEAIAPDRTGDRDDDHQINAPDVDEIRDSYRAFSARGWHRRGACLSRGMH